jgi:hypothetical protein
MASRLNCYFRQKVTEAKLDEGFEKLEKADHNLIIDISVFGILNDGSNRRSHGGICTGVQ